MTARAVDSSLWGILQSPLVTKEGATFFARFLKVYRVLEILGKA